MSEIVIINYVEQNSIVHDRVNICKSQSRHRVEGV